MKNSHKNLVGSILSRGSLLSIGLALAAAVSPLATAVPASAQSTQYQPWTGTQAGQASQKLVTDLKAIIAQGEKDQAASPDFLADLKKAIAAYETATTPAPVSQAKPFSDNFADGEFLNNPTWKVTAGTWSVDKGGSNIGLVSKMRQQANLQNLLGNLLNQGTTTQQQQNQTQYSAIYTKAKLPAAFTYKMTLTSKDRYGGLNASLYQGASAQNQYRLTYQPGNATGLVLQRVSAQGATTIGSYNGGVNLEDGKPHEITLSRDTAGKMLVLVDGKQAISASDTSLAGDFDGILLTNVGGSYWIRSITVAAYAGS